MISEFILDLILIARVYRKSKEAEKRGVERRSARRSSLKGRERGIVIQMNIGTASKATLGTF